LLIAPNGVTVAQLATTAARQWTPRLQEIESARILCILRRFASDSKESEYRDSIKTSRWEIPLCELTLRSPT
jgi:hypothetical protein